METKGLKMKKAVASSEGTSDLSEMMALEVPSVLALGV